MDKTYDRKQGIKYYRREKCIVCDEKISNILIRLPRLPLTEKYITHEGDMNTGILDQEFAICHKCGTGQILNIIDSSLIYSEDYYARTSISQASSTSIDEFLKFIFSHIATSDIKSVVDVGCNDLYALKQFKKYTNNLWGIDPIFQFQENNVDKDINVIGDFFENVDLNKEGIELDVVLSSHTLEHIENPKLFIKNLVDHSTEKTSFFFQFPALEPLINNARFEHIFHQHLNYFSLKSIAQLLDDLDLELIDYKFNIKHWGSLIVFFKKKLDLKSSNVEKYKTGFIDLNNKCVLEQYKFFRSMVSVANQRINSLKTKKLYAFGASLMFPIIHYHLPALKYINKIIDDDIRKKGLYYINLPFEIVSSENIPDLQDSSIVVTAITTRQSLRAITKKLIEKNIKNIIIPTNLL